MNDPLIDDVRRVRHELSREHAAEGFDLVAHYAALAASFEREPIREAEPPAATAEEDSRPSVAAKQGPG